MARRALCQVPSWSSGIGGQHRGCPDDRAHALRPCVRVARALDVRSLGVGASAFLVGGFSNRNPHPAMPQQGGVCSSSVNMQARPPVLFTDQPADGTGLIAKLSVAIDHWCRGRCVDAELVWLEPRGRNAFIAFAQRPRSSPTKGIRHQKQRDSRVPAGAFRQTRQPTR